MALALTIARYVERQNHRWRHPRLVRSVAVVLFSAVLVLCSAGFRSLPAEQLKLSAESYCETVKNVTICDVAERRPANAVVLPAAAELIHRIGDPAEQYAITFESTEQHPETVAVLSGIKPENRFSAYGLVHSEHYAEHSNAETVAMGLLGLQHCHRSQGAHISQGLTKVGVNEVETVQAARALSNLFSRAPQDDDLGVFAQWTVADFKTFLAENKAALFACDQRVDFSR